MTGLKRLLAWNAAFGSKGGLPLEYQQVEYLEATGTQYIDSGILCTSDLAVRFAFEVPTLESTALCGGINVNDPIFRHHAIAAVTDTANYVYYLALGGVRMIPTDIQAPKINTKYEVFIDPAAGVYDITGPDYDEKGTFTPLANRSTGKGYGILGRIANTGALQARANKTYYFKFFRGGELIGDFVPCYRKSDNEPGMYDLVGKAFHTNAGTGDITVGPDV